MELFEASIKNLLYVCELAKVLDIKQILKEKMMEQVANLLQQKFESDINLTDF